MKEHQVILVNDKDEPLGLMEKMEAHEKGLMHRAFSVFIFDRDGRMLLQQRAATKYHGAFLWTNACCSHPFFDEDVKSAAARRLNEELGFTTSISKIFDFTYKAEVENNLTEHEFDHVFAGEYAGTIFPNKNEVNAYAYYSMNEIHNMLKEHPQKFTTWFKLAFPKVKEWWQKAYTANSVNS